VKTEPIANLYSTQQEDIVELDLEREWYNTDESTSTLIEASDATELFLGRRPMLHTNRTKIKAAAAQKLSDQNSYEQEQLRKAGLFTQNSANDNDENEERVHLIVHDIKPAFLSNRTVYTKQQSMVSVVKDPTSDMAVLSRQGSETLSRYRSEREKLKGFSNERFWELKNTHLGKVVGVKSESNEEDVVKEKTFAETMMGKELAKVSEFSQSKSIRQQKEFLPIFTVKKELMRVISENIVTVIVGATG